MTKLVPKHHKLLIQIVMTIFIIIWLIPLYFFITRSFSMGGIDNYIHVLSIPLFPRFYLNSLIIGTSVVVIKLIIIVFAGYAFSQMRLPGKEFLFLIALVALMIPPAALLVPLFQLMVKLNWLNTYYAVIGPEIALGLPFILLLARIAIDEIPKDLFEAASLDGCSHFQKLQHLVLPIIVPVLSTAAVLSFLDAWNHYLFPLVFMKDESMYTVTLSLNYFKGEFGVDVGKMFAAMVLICIPVVITYMFSQRFLQKGLVSGAVK